MLTVSYFVRIIKAILFWSYARSTWQYDVLCALILAFIFLTPKSWFGNSELRRRQQHQSPVASVYLPVGAENLSAQADKSEIERRVRAITGRPEIQVTKVRRKQDAQGQTIAYEVDIR